MQANWMFKVLLGLFLLLFLPAASAGNMHFERLMFHGGMSKKNNNVSAIRATIKDKQGFVWFAGENGLGRYDGNELIIYKNDTENPRSLSANFIWTITIDKEGVLWIGTSGGLNRFNRDTNDFDRFMADSNSINSLSNNYVYSLDVDVHNNLIIGTANGLSILNSQRTHFQTHYHHPDGNIGLGRNHVRKVFIDSKNRIWVGANETGLNLFDRETGKFLSYRNDPKDPASISGDSVASIEEDSNGRLWVGTYSQGLNLMSQDEKTFEQFRHNPADITSLGSNNVTSILEDTYKNLWIATDHGGLNLYQPDTKNFRRFTHSHYDAKSIGSNHLYQIYEDEQSNLWIGMFPSGVSFLDRSATFFTHYSHKPDDVNSLSEGGVLSFFEDSEGLLWIGTENGLTSFDRKKSLFTRHFVNTLNDQSSNFSAVLTIEEDDNGELWIGTWARGLYRYNKNTKEAVNYLPDKSKPTNIGSAFVWKIVRDKDNIIWLATQMGVNRYDRAIDGFTHYSADPRNPHALISNQLREMLEDSKGFLWVATLEGLDRFDKSTLQFKHFAHNPQDSDSIRGTQMISLYEDSRGKIWIGTRDAGVNIYDPITQKFSSLNEKNGLPSSTVSSIVEDNKGNIWVTTLSGIACINYRTLEIKSFNTSHGLLSDNFNRNATFKDAEGRLYMGSIAGISSFNPAEVTLDTSAPPVVITRLKIRNKPVTINDTDGILVKSITETTHLTLDYDDAMFSFDFAALSYRSPSYNEYAYKLDGFDEDWHNIGNQQTATYTNINPGRYIFKVKAANKDGIWNETGASITIDITPPPWRTWWAYLVYGLIFFSIIFMVNKYKNLRITSNVYRHLSATDSLTGILNRAGIARVADDFFGGRKTETSVGILIVDIDHFKLINDARGHDAGDRVLKEFATLIARTIRSGDSLARWGGEEFVLLCPQVTKDGVVSLAEKIRNIISGHVFEQEGTPLKVTASIGVVFATTQEPFERLFKLADIALYRAKNSGRNRVELHESQQAPG